MNYISLIIYLLLSATTAIAQSLIFDNSTWDFGTIAEDGGEVSHTFNFKNVSPSPIVIINATTTCGCTVPQYSKRPIASGAEATMEITYDPLYRPGRFVREVKIYTSVSPEPEIIKIVGDVTPRKKSVQESHPYLLGDGVRINSLYGFLQNISPSAPRSYLFEVINTADQSRQITIKSEFSTPYLKIYPSTQSLSAGQSGVINVTYEIDERRPFYGQIADDLVVYIDNVSSSHTVQLRAYGVDDFTNDTKKRGARAQFSEKIINFEPFKVDKGSLAKSFSIKNIGSEPLFIRAIESPKDIEVTPLFRDEIPSGATQELSVRIKPKEANLGDFMRYITFILNDKEQPVVRFKIVGRGEK